MVKRIPTMALAAGVAALGALDWCVAGSTAAGPKDQQKKMAAPKPSSLPVQADLTKPLAVTKVHGLDARLQRHGTHGYALRVTNRTTALVNCEYEVETWETSGVSVGRRGPRAQKRATEKLRLSVAPGRSVVHVLKFQDPAPKPAQKAAGTTATTANPAATVQVNGQTVTLEAALTNGASRAFRSLEFRFLRPVQTVRTDKSGDEVRSTVRKQFASLRYAGTGAAQVLDG